MTARLLLQGKERCGGGWQPAELIGRMVAGQMQGDVCVDCSEPGRQFPDLFGRIVFLRDHQGRDLDVAFGGRAPDRFQYGFQPRPAKTPIRIIVERL